MGTSVYMGVCIYVETMAQVLGPGEYIYARGTTYQGFSRLGEVVVEGILTRLAADTKPDCAVLARPRQ